MLSLSMLSLLPILQNILYFLVVVVIVVVVHEMGHYVVARWCGVAVRIFSVGFGPVLFGWSARSGTRFCISAVPLGGYVRMEGWSRLELEEMPEDQRGGAFINKPLWQRTLVVLAGPLANFLLTVLLLTFLYAIQGAPVRDKGQGVEVGEVVATSPAEQAGLRAGDRITAIDAEKLRDFSDLVRTVAASEGRVLVLEILRNTETRSVQLRPQAKEGGGYRIGVGLATSKIERLSPVSALLRASKDCARLIREILIAIKELIAGERSTKELSGPVGLAKISGDAARAGVASFFFFTAILSVNLGLLNLFPLPVLDGGHLLLYAVEFLRQKPLDEKVQQSLSVCGFVMLLTLMLWVTSQDILRFVLP